METPSKKITESKLVPRFPGSVVLRAIEKYKLVTSVGTKRGTPRVAKCTFEEKKRCVLECKVSSASFAKVFFWKNPLKSHVTLKCCATVREL